MAGTAAPIHTSRNLWIDTLRGIAALAVVVHHLNAHTKYVGNFFNEVTVYGRSGVEIFFFISGFCVQAASYRVASVTEFFWHRLWRIFPPYLFSLVVVFAVAMLRKISIGVNDAASFPADVSGWFATLTIMTKPASPTNAINWVYWTLTYEIIFYLVIGLAMLAKKCRYLVLFLVCALSLIKSVAEVPGLFFLDHWCLFGLGVAFYEYSSGKRLEGALLGILCLCGLIAYFEWSVIIIISLTLLVTAVSVYKPDNFLGRKNPLTFVGTISYSLYLLHVPLGVFAFVGLQPTIGAEAFPVNLLYYAAMLSICLVGAYYSYRFIEKPSLNIGKAFPRINLRFSRKAFF
jgi:peptidoglycan/LPS O-acetylase OafA/YrhL